MFVCVYYGRIGTDLTSLHLGILGLDFLTLFDWDFDIDKGTVYISTAPKERKAPLPFDAWQGGLSPATLT